MILRGDPYGMADHELHWIHIANGKHREIPRDTPQVLADVISNCLTTNPKNRIDTNCIMQLLSILNVHAESGLPPAVNGHSHVIHFAAKNGQLDIIQRLVARDSGLINLRDNYNQTPSRKASQVAANSTLSSNEETIQHHASGF
jgi:hypothetical protein